MPSRGIRSGGPPVGRSDCQQISAHPSERNASRSPPPPVGPPVVVPPSPVAPTVIVSTALITGAFRIATAAAIVRLRLQRLRAVGLRGERNPASARGARSVPTRGAIYGELLGDAIRLGPASRYRGHEDKLATRGRQAAQNFPFRTSARDLPGRNSRTTRSSSVKRVGTRGAFTGSTRQFAISAGAAGCG